MKNLSAVLFITSIGLLSACSGGGGGSGAVVTTPTTSETPTTPTTPSLASMFKDGYPQGENVVLNIGDGNYNYVLELNSVEGTYSSYLPAGTYGGSILTENMILSSGNYDPQTGALDGITYFNSVSAVPQDMPYHDNLDNIFKGIYGEGNVALIAGKPFVEPNFVGMNATPTNNIPKAGHAVFSGKSEVAVSQSGNNNASESAQGNSITSVNFDSGIADVKLSGFNGNLVGLDVDIQNMQLTGNSFSGGASSITLPDGRKSSTEGDGGQSGMFFGTNAEQVGGTITYSDFTWGLDGAWTGTK